MGVKAQPVGKGIFGDIASGEGQHGEYAIRVIYLQPPTIELQKQLCRHQSGALVAIGKCMVARNAITSDPNCF